jgi:hypothetical protein
MQINDAIVKADELRMNSLDDEQKARWLYELDCEIADMMGVSVPEWDFPCERELLMSTPHEDIYVKYLVAMIDYYNGEGELYANDITIFNDAYAKARAWWIRHNRPKSAGNWRV